MIQIDFKGKNALVLGVANRMSIAWAIANKLHQAGAQVILTYQDERFEEKVKSLSKEINSPLVCRCDVRKKEEVSGLFEEIKNKIGFLDFLIHSIAFAPSQALKGDFKDISKEDFQTTFEISFYSFIELSREFLKISKEKGSIVALTFEGSRKVFPNYKIMGPAKAALESAVIYLAYELGKKKVRVNAISPGPVPTLAASGIEKFSEMLRIHREKSPLQRNIAPEEIANLALFLCSDLSSGITGEIVHVDAGYNIMGV